MKKTAIISEFNPFHNGHKYILKKAREITKSDVIICIMSGDLVQRGELSLIDKFKRADSAINYCDMVIEMPSFVTLQSANMFAFKNIEILNKLDIDYLAFGIENIGEEEFLENAKVLIDNDKIISDNIKSLLSKGLSYTKASYLASSKLINDESFLSSNNILAIEYMRAIKMINPSIKVMPIRRQGSMNKDENFSDDFYASSTSIRNNLKNKKISSYMPKVSNDKLSEFLSEYKSFPNNNLIYDTFRYKLLIEKKDMSDILCFEKGLDNLFIKICKESHTFNDFIEKSVSQRFTKSRIKRLLLNYLLDNKTYLNDIEINFAKILAFNKKSTSIIKQSKMNFVIQKKDSEILSFFDKKIYDKMIDASNLYSLSINRDFNYDFTKSIKIKESSL